MDCRRGEPSSNEGGLTAEVSIFIVGARCRRTAPEEFDGLRSCLESVMIAELAAKA